jgi:hypothetical protein
MGIACDTTRNELRNLAARVDDLASKTLAIPCDYGLAAGDGPAEALRRARIKCDDYANVVVPQLTKERDEWRGKALAWKEERDNAVDNWNRHYVSFVEAERMRAVVEATRAYLNTHPYSVNGTPLGDLFAAMHAYNQAGRP